MAVGTHHRNAAPQPQRTRALVGGILHQPDRGLERRLDRSSRGVVPGDRTARWAIARFADEMLASSGFVGLINETPHLAVGIAEARGCAQLLGVRQRHGGTAHDLGLILIALAARALGAVELRLGVRAVT